MLEIGSIIGGRYKVLHRVGRGGMSNVYLVLNEAANKQWAVKEIRKSSKVEHRIIQQNLIAETKILKQLHHSNLPSIVDIFKQDGKILIVMDYIEGITLAKKIEEDGPQPEEDVVKWALQICDVFNYLHNQKPPIIYRDTKPSNIMLKPDGNVVLIDFGTAREYKDVDKTEDTHLLGTVGYAAPEQYGGYGQSDERTDIYNLGATMYHLVTGHNPNRPPYEMFPIRHWDRSLSSGLEKIILKCTKANPKERYQDCKELAYDLKNYKSLSDDSIRSTKLKWGAFITVLTMTLVFFICGFSSGKYASGLKTDQYDLFIQKAGSATTKEAQTKNYVEAININPSQLDAYQKLLNKVYLIDGNFTTAEAEEFSDILGADNNGVSHEESLRLNETGYDEFAYDMGLAYFYYYEENGNKQLSEPWFDIARKSTTLNETKVGRAERFSRIAEYYNSLSIVDKAGDSEVSYADYWKALYDVTNDNIAEEDNVKTAIVMYKELLSQIVMHASEFQKAGVGKVDLAKGMTICREGMEQLKSKTLDDYDKENILYLEELLTKANDSITTAYAERETEPEAEPQAESQPDANREAVAESPEENTDNTDIQNTETTEEGEFAV